jgi:hypothetical protein
VGKSIKNLVRKPNAGHPPVRFDEWDLETGLCATAPDLDSTPAGRSDELIADIQELAAQHAERKRVA